MQASPVHDSEPAQAALQTERKPSARGLQALNAAAIIMVALYFGYPLLMPLVLAVLLAFVLAPVVRLLQRVRLGHAPAVLVTVALTFCLIGGFGVVVGNQGANLAAGLPRYSATIQDKVRALSVGKDLLQRLVTSAEQMVSGEHVTADAQVEAAPTEPQPAPTAAAPSTLVVARVVLQPLLSPLATAGAVVIFVIFILLYQEDLRDRVVALMGSRDLHRTILALNEAARRLSRFFLAQVALNTGFGAYVTVALWLAGLPNPLLWGMLAGLMRFVPFIGGIIALVPPVTFALAVAPGWGLAGTVLAIILGGDLVMGQVVEPLAYGQRTGLSPVAIILSTAFWAFIWGPVGLLLATPLTVCLAVMGRHVPALSFMHVMLGAASPLEPRERFYQRALEGNRTELGRQAREEIARTSRDDYFDTVALSGMTLAQRDLTRDAISFERMDELHGHIQVVLAALHDGANVTADARGALRQVGAMRVVPGRGPLDDLAAMMAVQVLCSHGYGADILPNAALGGRSDQEAGLANARICCISAMNEGSSASSIRFFVRRIQRRMPDATIIVCLWQAQGGDPTLAALRSEGGDEFIVLSMGELVALAAVLDARTTQADAGTVAVAALTEP